MKKILYLLPLLAMLMQGWSRIQEKNSENEQTFKGTIIINGSEVLFSAAQTMGK